MNVFRKMFKRLRMGEKAQGMVEYGLILALISVVVVGSLGGVGDKVKDNFGLVVDGSDVVGGGSDLPEIEIPAPEESEGGLEILTGIIPISNADELNRIGSDEASVFGIGTDSEGLYIPSLCSEYIQVSDIDMSTLEDFVPIGDGSYIDNTTDEGGKLVDTSPSNRRIFTGSFNGDSYKIRNLNVDRTEDFVGLFGRTDGATLRNISIEGGAVKGAGNYNGGLVGVNNDSLIDNCYFSGTLEGSSNTGGLVGQSQGTSVISNSHFSGIIKGGSRTGGLVCSNLGEIKNSYSSGELTGEFNIGGFVGLNFGEISKSYSTMKINGSRAQTGGFVGVNAGGVDRCYATGSVYGFGNTGGFVGFNQTNGLVTNSYTTGSVSSPSANSDTTAGFVGYNSGGVVSNSGWANNINSRGAGKSDGSFSAKGEHKNIIDSIIASLFITK